MLSVAFSECHMLSVIQKIQIQNTQTSQLFMKIIKTESIYEVFKIPSWKAWVQRPSGLIKSGRKRKRF